MTEANVQSVECERLIWDRDMRILEEFAETENSSSSAGSISNPNLNLSSMCSFKDFQVRLIFCLFTCSVLVSSQDEDLNN